MAAFEFPLASRIFCSVMLAASGALLACPAWAKAPKLPSAAPIPELNRQAQPLPATETPRTAPKPAQKPPETAAPQPPETAPTPEEKPGQTQKKARPADPRAKATPAAKMPPEEIACRQRLKALGVEFKDHAPEHDADTGCSIPYPVMVSTLGKSIAVTPAAELNCPMAEAVARFAADVIAPAASAELGANLKSVGQASAYVCRPRHNGTKISEHAFGNALDIASLTLSDDTRIEIGPVPPQKQAKFLARIRKAACGPFKTVLGPGSDADHSLHFHFDLEPRRNGGTFCQ